VKKGDVDRGKKMKEDYERVARKENEEKGELTIAVKEGKGFSFFTFFIQIGNAYRFVWIDPILVIYLLANMCVN
jgi:hypothetical protein